MEFDLLNEIMTSTVGQLFGKIPPRKPTESLLPSSKPRFLPLQSPFIDSLPQFTLENPKKPSNIQTNHEILMKKSNSLNFETGVGFKKSSDEFNFNFIGINSNQSKPEIMIPNGNNSNPKPEEQKPKEDIKSKRKSGIVSLEAWLGSDGPALLQECMRKLKLDEKQIHKASLEGMGLSELEERKKLVKNELKRYDFTFESLFNRPPIRHEKEPMRPLYIYYKLIKQSLAKEPVPNEKSQQSQAQSGNPVPSKDPKPGAGSNPRVPENYQKSKSFEVSNPDGNKQERPVKFSIVELKKRLEELKRAKNELRNKLHNYQQSFTKDNNRKIKYHKDIAPVEEDYKRYKDLKVEIQKLEEIINSGNLK